MPAGEAEMMHQDSIFTLERVSGPDIEPISLAEMKLSLREFASMTDRDAEISDLITGAREWVENFTGRVLIDQSWLLTIERHHRRLEMIGCRHGLHGGYFDWRRVNEILLRKSPVLSVESVKSVDQNGVETDIDPGAYMLQLPNSKWPKLVSTSGNSWSYDLLQITFRAGFADRLGSPQDDSSSVPSRYKQAMKIWVEANYDCDTDRMELLLRTAEALIKSERVEMSLA